MKTLAKRLLHLTSIAIVAPLLCTHSLTSLLSSADASLETHSQLLSLLPGKLGSYLRVAFYRFTLDHCDRSATISFGVLFSKAGASVGRHAYIGPRCMLGLVTLEDDVLLGPCVQIPSGPKIHGIESLEIPIRNQPGDPVRVTIGRDSWIGANATVLADIAPQCVVGAGSIVTKPTAARTIVAGIPAKEIAKRGQPTTLPEGVQANRSPATQVDEVRADHTTESRVESW